MDGIFMADCAGQRSPELGVLCKLKCNILVSKIPAHRPVESQGVLDSLIFTLGPILHPKKNTLLVSWL